MITADRRMTVREISNELEISAKSDCKINAKVDFRRADTVPFSYHVENDYDTQQT